MPSLIQSLGGTQPEQKAKKASPHLDGARALIELAKNSQQTAPSQDNKIIHTEDFGSRFLGQFTDPGSETWQGVKKLGGIIYESTAKPFIKAGLNWNPITQGIQSGKEIVQAIAPGGKTGMENEPLIRENPYTGQVGELSVKQNLALGAEVGSNFLGGGMLDDAVKLGIKSFPKLASAAEGALIGGLGLGGYEGQKEESTLKSIAQQTAIGAGAGLVLGFGAPAVAGMFKYTKGRLAQEGVTGFTKEVEFTLKENGLLEEATGIMEKTKQEMPALKERGITSTFDEVFTKNLQESQNGKKIYAAVGKMEEVVPGGSTKGLESGKGKTKVKTAIKDTVDHRIPTEPIVVSKRSLLIKQFKDQAKGATAGARSMKTDLQSLKKNAETFIKQTIPDSGLTKGEASRLLSSLSKVANEKQLDMLQDQALKIAEDTAQKELASDLTMTVRDVLSKQPKITGSMIGKAGEVSASRFAVAQSERLEVNLLENFLKIAPEDKPVKSFKSAAAFLKAHPIFAPLSKNMVDAVAGISSKTVKDFDAASLGRLQGLVDSLIEAGKARTKTDLIRRGQSIETMVDNMSRTGKFVDVNSADARFSASEWESQFWTTQTWFDQMDGNIASRSKYKSIGEVERSLKHPVDDGAYLARKEGQEFATRWAAVIKGKGFAETEWSRIAIYAYSKQPSAKGALLKQVSQELIDSIKLSPAEQEVYDFMRKELDGIKPQLDGVMMESQGRMVGFIEDYFPLNRDYDSFDEVAHMIEDSLTGRHFRKDLSDFKQSPKFGNISKSRTGKIDKFADINLHAGEIFSKYMEKAVYFKNMELPIQNIELTLANDRFKSLVGKDATNFLNLWKKRLARAGGKEKKLQGVDNLMNLFKRNLSIAYLARISTATKQFTSGLLATGYINPARTIEGFALLSSSKWRKLAYDKSKTLRLRSGGDLDLFDIAQSMELSAKKTFLGAVQRTNVKTQQLLIKNTVERADALTATAVWLGSYKKSMKMFAGDEARAIKYADDIVDRTQVSSHFKDISRAQNFSTLTNALMPFQTFVIGQWNVIRQDILKATWLSVEERNFWGALDSAGIAIALLMAMAAEEAIDYSTANPEYKEDTLVDHWKKNALPAAYSTLPVAGGILSEIERGYGSSGAVLGYREVGDVAEGAMHPLKVWDEILEVYTGGLEEGFPKSIKSGSALLGLPVGMIQNIYRMSNTASDLFEEPLSSGSLGGSQIPNLYDQ